jgi:UDP-glucose 4-epimerase
MKTFEGKRVLVLGGTGSLGQIFLRMLLSGENGVPQKIIVFSRDEAKQHHMRSDYLNGENTDEVVRERFRETVEFQIGDVRDFLSVSSALRRADIVVSAAALKQVPSCEYFVEEAVRTNILGPSNIVKAISEHSIPIETVVGISTDKACKPVNSMGMTKAIQEKIFTSANVYSDTRFVCVRYGNVLSSRGSVIPLFYDQISKGGPVTITSMDMTRFLMSLEEAVGVVVEAIENGDPGTVVVPLVPSARIIDLAKALIGKSGIKIKEVGIRPGEKMHEILISEEEVDRTKKHGDYIHILSSLPEVSGVIPDAVALSTEYSSKDNLMSVPDLEDLLRANNLLQS